MRSLEVVGRRRASALAGAFFVFGVVLGASSALLWSQGRLEKQRVEFLRAQSTLQTWMQHLSQAQMDTFGDLGAVTADGDAPQHIVAASQDGKAPAPADAYSPASSSPASNTTREARLPEAQSPPPRGQSQPQQRPQPTAPSRPQVQARPDNPPASRPAPAPVKAPTAATERPSAQSSTRSAAASAETAISASRSAQTPAPTPAPTPAVQAPAVAHPTPVVQQGTLSAASPPGAAAVVRASFEQANIAALTSTSVQFRSGRVVDRGELFPSGERLLNVIPSEGKIITDRRVIVLTVE